MVLGGTIQNSAWSYRVLLEICEILTQDLEDTNINQRKSKIITQKTQNLRGLSNVGYVQGRCICFTMRMKNTSYIKEVAII